jgi:hypothetical protein
LETFHALKMLLGQCNSGIHPSVVGLLAKWRERQLIMCNTSLKCSKKSSTFQVDQHFLANLDWYWKNPRAIL